MDRRRIILIAVLLIVLVLLFVSKMFSGGENSPNSDTGKIESVGLLKMVPKNKKNELQNIPKIEIIVSNRNISVGEIFTKDMVRWRSWPENALEDGAITKESWPEILDKIQEYIATTDFQIGEPITRLKINKMSTASFISAALRSGMTAVTYSMSRDSNNIGFVMPGDYVDIAHLVKETPKMSFINGSSIDNSSSIEYVISNVRVLAVDGRVNNANKEVFVDSKMITVELTKKQAKIFYYLSGKGSIFFFLKSSQDIFAEKREIFPEVLVDVRKRSVKQKNILFIKGGKRFVEMID